MKTILPAAIDTVEEAKNFLHSLHSNGESFHPEDDAHDILWYSADPTEEECDQLNKLMRDIYALPECTMQFDADKGMYMDFDPCGYLLDLHNELINDLR